jgi:hypothetical protein
MANSFNSTREVVSELMVDFEYKTPMISTMWKEFQDRFLTVDGWDRGNLIDIGLPNQYNVGDGETITSIPDFNEQKITLSLDFRKHIPMNFTTQQMTLYTKFKFRERFIDPASDTLADVTESILAEEIFKKVYLLSGTAGVAPNSYASIAGVRAKMNKMGIPNRNRWLAFDEDNYSEIISAGTLQNSFDMKLTRDINRDAQLGRIAQFQSYSSPLLYQHQAGIGDGTATPASGLVSCGTVKTTVTSGTSMVLTGLPVSQADTLRVGDKLIFGLESGTTTTPYHIQPKTKSATNIPFSVTLTDVGTGATDGSGEITVSFEPSIVSASTDPYRNISDTSGLQAGTTASLVTANTGVGSATKAKYKLNLCYITPALIFAAPPLRMPEGIPDKAKTRVVDKDNGLSLRMYTFTNGTDDLDTKRLDILFGIKVYNPLIFGLLG